MKETINHISLKEFCGDNHLNYSKTFNFLTDQIRKAQELLNRILIPTEITEFIEMAKIYFNEKNSKELKL